MNYSLSFFRPGEQEERIPFTIIIHGCDSGECAVKDDCEQLPTPMNVSSEIAAVLKAVACLSRRERLVSPKSILII